MERKLGRIGLLCLFILVGLSVNCVNCQSGNNIINVTIDNATKVSKKLCDKTNLDLKVEAIYHNGKLKRLMSYLSTYRNASLNSNETVQVQVLHPKMDVNNLPLAKYKAFFEKIPCPQSFPEPLVFSANTSYPTATEFFGYLKVNTNYSPNFQVVQKEEWTGLFVQCDSDKGANLVEPQPQPKLWYLTLCLSGGNGSENASLPQPFGPVNSTTVGIPVYTILISTTANVLYLKPEVNFDLKTFLEGFPWDLMDIKDVVVHVALYSEQEKKMLRNVMNSYNYTLEGCSLSKSECSFVIVEVEKKGSAVIVEKNKGNGGTFFVGLYICILIYIVCTIFIVVYRCKYGDLIRYRCCSDGEQDESVSLLV